ncbi:MAG: excinuclease ABC subunit C [Balneola sp.]|jgi:putative endonuclease|nr:excinuclease ABC subunit C [Balneola sp.]MBE78295.1 excinuclease ABC subunit C [Balneola sp.]|tara:strand:- start:214 stop:540 length:327 start_codon:yes stop_codon:yes gene_type:complete
MARDKNLYVYILTNKNHTVLYTGVTSDLVNRVWQHKNRQVKGFTKRYNLDQLIYFEGPGDPIYAIEREKQIKSGSRQKKIDLVNSMNPTWKDLYNDIIPGGFKDPNKM